MSDMTTLPEQVPSATIDYSKEMSHDDIRDAVRNIMRQRGISQKWIGLQADVSETTMQAFMAGKYAGNNDKQADKLRLWLYSDQSLARTRSAVTDIDFSATKTSSRILGALHHAHSLADIAVVSGGAGIGKTTSCKRYRETHPNVWLLNGQPMIASAFAMLEELREALNIPQTTPHKLSRAIIGKLTGTGGMLILDEAQHVTAQAIEQLRCVHDQAGIGLAFVGNEEVWGRIDGGGRKSTYAQVYSRVGIRVTVTKASPKDVEAILDTANITDAHVRALLKTIAGKPGALRGMVKVLRNARFLAKGSEELLSEVHIRAAWERYEGVPEVAA